MKLARAIHCDESDMNVYHSPARTGEWCISGGFEFWKANSCFNSTEKEVAT